MVIGRSLAVRLGALVVRTGFLVGSIASPRPYVVFATQQDDRLRGNLSAIHAAVGARAPGTRIRTLAYRRHRGLRGRLADVGNALRAGYHLARARLVIVDAWFFPMDVIQPRRGTTRVQVWHAAGAFKRFGYGVLGGSFGPDEEMIRLVRIHGNYSLCLTSSAAATDAYMDAFRLPRERFTSAIGVPRTDVLFDAERSTTAISRVRTRYRLPDNVRVLLYAPTFRGDTVAGARYDGDLDLAALRRALGEQWVVLMRLHPFVRRAVSLTGFEGFAVDVSDWRDMNELLLVADLLVTDYSSAIFEFSLLGRPIAFLAPDLAAYERERGFYLEVPAGLPGPLFTDAAGLAAWVAAGEFDQTLVRRFAERWFDVADGRASSRFVDWVVAPALRGEPLRVEA